MDRATVQGFACCDTLRRRLRHGGFALVAVLVAGCSDRLLDTGLGFDYLVDARPAAGSTSDNSPPSPVRHLSDENTSWPSLATVPPRPRDAMPLSERRLTLNRLAEERGAGVRAGAALRSQEPPLSPLLVPAEPAAVPPVPNVGQSVPPPPGTGTPLPRGEPARLY